MNTKQVLNVVGGSIKEKGLYLCSMDMEGIAIRVKDGESLVEEVKFNELVNVEVNNDLSALVLDALNGTYELDFSEKRMFRLWSFELKAKMSGSEFKRVSMNRKTLTSGETGGENGLKVEGQVVEGERKRITSSTLKDFINLYDLKSKEKSVAAGPLASNENEAKKSRGMFSNLRKSQNTVFKIKGAVESDAKAKRVNSHAVATEIDKNLMSSSSDITSDKESSENDGSECIEVHYCNLTNVVTVKKLNVSSVKDVLERVERQLGVKDSPREYKILKDQSDSSVSVNSPVNGICELYVDCDKRSSGSKSPRVKLDVDMSKIPPPTDKRTRIVHEMLSTEKSYVEYLITIVNVYLKPLREMAKDSDGFPSLEIINKLFPKSLEPILEFNMEFFNLLYEKLVTGDIESIGSIFLSYGNFLKMYGIFANEYSTCNQMFLKSLKVYPALGAKMEQLGRTIGSNIRYEDLIIMPVQRVMRYSLLLGELLNNTPEDHRDYKAIQDSLALVNQINDFINEFVRKNESLKMVQFLLGKGINIEKLLIPTRYLICDESFKVQTEKLKYLRHFFVFNDVLVSIKESKIKNGVDLANPKSLWPIKLCWFKEDHKGSSLIGPNNVRFEFSKHDRTKHETFFKLLKKAIGSAGNADDKSDISDYRHGEYMFPNGEYYSGDWYLGMKHGKGVSIVAGSIYEGEFSHGKFNGHGRMTYITSDIYEGEWKDDVQCGHGALKTSENKIIYDGYWENGNFSGQGVYNLINGNEFRGEWSDGQLSGSGEAKSSNGSRYLGQWKNNLFHGDGALTIPNLYEYNGRFLEGLKSDSGEIRYSSCTYRGSFGKDLRNGHGNLEAMNKSYDGEWLDNYPHGNGSMIYHSLGINYSGKWTRGELRNSCICTYSDNSSYEGSIFGGRYHGAGTLKTGYSKYVGDWNQGVREGKGTLMFEAKKYEGMWANDMPSKMGVYLNSGDDIFKSYKIEWEDGVFDGKGALVLANEDSYKGYLKGGCPNGLGTWISGNTKLNCKWNRGLAEARGSYTVNKKVYQGFIEKSKNMFQIDGTHGKVIYLRPQMPLLAFKDIDINCHFQLVSRDLNFYL